MNAKGKTHRRRHGPRAIRNSLRSRPSARSEAADVVAHFAKRGNSSNARRIVESHLKPGVDRAALALSRDDGDRQGA